MAQTKSHRYIVVDAFTTTPLEGNPLAVFPEASDFDEATMLKIAKELNLAETASAPYLHQVKAPLLLLQGENDPRVPKEEAQQVFDALKAAGKTVELHYYPQEGHGFEKRENRIDALLRIVEWFTKYLK